jgi:TrwC relaxase
MLRRDHWPGAITATPICSHLTLVNNLHTDAGRVVALNTRRLRHRVHEIGRQYHDSLGQHLTSRGIAVGRQGFATVATKIDQSLVEAFTRRSQEAVRMAQRWAAETGRAVTPSQVHAAAWEARKGKGQAERPARQEWQQRAQGAGWKPSQSQSVGRGYEPPKHRLGL